LVLDVDGQDSEPFPLQPVPVNAHILTVCDVKGAVPPPRACERLAFHIDGTPVDPVAPARRGEVVLIYAFGLGAVSPAVETGKPSPIGSEAVDGENRRVWATLRNQPLNASGSVARFFDVEAMTQPAPGLLFAGLVPGLVGLYQINVRVPPSFEVLLPCGGEIRSNALVLVTTKQGSDTVPLCVAP
jgi:uncharacterized protein (TIGR03437 family)